MKYKISLVYILKFVPILLLAGADSLARDMFGETPVDAVIEKGRKEIGEIFLKLCKKREE